MVHNVFFLLMTRKCLLELIISLWNCRNFIFLVLGLHLCVKTWSFVATVNFWSISCLSMLYFPGKIICATSVNDLDILLEIVQIWLYVTTVDFLGENSFNFCRSFHDLSEREEKMEYKNLAPYMTMNPDMLILLINLLLAETCRLLCNCWILFYFSHIAAECNSSTMCWNCKEPGHLANQCPNDPVCHMCGKVGHLARDCMNPGLPTHDARLCNNCYKPGHIAADCSNEKACNNCRKTGHLARDCPNEPVCNICNISGHVARQCPKSSLASEMGGPFRDIICRSCGELGHISRDCIPIVICINCGGRGHQAYECPSARMFDRGLHRYWPYWDWLHSLIAQDLNPYWPPWVGLFLGLAYWISCYDTFWLWIYWF